MKNKIILSILIVSMIALIFSGCDGVDTVIPPIPDDEEISDYFRLDVPYIEQNSNNTCLPASGAIILKYYEDPRDIAEIRDKLALPWQEDGTGGIMVSGHGYIAKLFDYVKSLGFTTKTEWDGLTIEEIKDKLEDGFPIIVLQDFYLDSNKEYDGHFSMIVGYRESGDNDEENKLIINDPWSSRGQYWEVTYSDFKIRNSNWWREQHNRNSDLSHSYIIWKDTSITNIYTITASAGSHGSISPSGSVTVNEGSDKSFTITPDIGYSIDGVLVDGISVGAVSSYTFTKVTEDHTIFANFISMPDDYVVEFKDPNLEQVIRETIGKPEGSLYLSDVIEITTLDAEERGIKSLKGIQHLQNLLFLDFGENQVSDISAVENLTNLQNLKFYTNQVTDISAVENLTNLQHLNFSENQVTDISAVENLTNLRLLGFQRNQVTDITALGNLTNLYYLIFSHNQVTDITVLGNLTNLKYLYFYDNQVTDIMALGNLTNLQVLYSWDNQVTDITVLENLTNLWSLRFGGNHVTDISAVENLTNLQSLYFDENHVKDISVLEKLTNLDDLRFYDNQVTDITALVKNEGLGPGDYISMRDNYLDLTEGSQNMQDIENLISRGVDVSYEPQRNP